MKKITFSLLCLLITSSIMAQTFPEGFETAVPPSGWVNFRGVNDEGNVYDWTSSDIAANGSQAAFVRYENVTNEAEDWLVTPQFTPSNSANILTFQQRQTFTSDFGSVYTIRVSTASQTTHADFVIIDTQNESDFGVVYGSRNVDLSAYNGIPIYIAFVMTNDDGDNWYIDDVNVVQDANPPACADNLSPANLATDVVVTGGEVVISWDAPSTGDPATSYEVFFGETSGSLSSLGTLSSTTVNITNVDKGVTYYWMIVPENVGGSATGCAEFSFTTEDPPPPPTNDACSTATGVFALPFNATLDASSATNNDGFITVTDCGSMNDGVWYTFTTVDAGTVDIAISAVSGMDPELAIYTGSCGAFVCVDNVDSGFSNQGETLSDVPVAAATQYWINIGHWSGSTDASEGEFTIDISTQNSTTLGIDDVNAIGSYFSYYPNPVQNTLTLESNQNIDSVILYNILGQKVLKLAPNSLSSTVDVSMLKRGVYLTKVSISGNTQTVRIIKQ